MFPRKQRLGLYFNQGNSNSFSVYTPAAGSVATNIHVLAPTDSLVSATQLAANRAAYAAHIAAIAQQTQNPQDVAQAVQAVSTAHSAATAAATAAANTGFMLPDFNPAGLLGSAVTGSSSGSHNAMIIGLAAAAGIAAFFLLRKRRR